MSDIQGTADRIFREEYGRVAASLLHVFRDFDIVEEAIQDAFVVALDRWHRDGVPDNPGAWITTAAKRKGIDRARRERVRTEKYEVLAAEESNEDDPFELVEEEP